MSWNKVQLLLGIILIILPFLGVPSSWKMIISIIIGVIFVLASIIKHVQRRGQVHDSVPSAL